MDKLTQDLLKQIVSLHEMPEGAVSFRKNGKSEIVKSTKNIEILPKEDLSGIDIFVKSGCKGESCHIPVVVTENDCYDLVYNDFYIEDGAEVTIVAGCGLHTDNDSSHDGIHTFHIGKNVKLTYIENHLALGKGKNKNLNPVTTLNVGENSCVVMKTTQIGGVDFSNRVTKAKLKANASLDVTEKILTDKFNVAKTIFKVDLIGENSVCNISSRSVAKGESEQKFDSTIVGKNKCFAHVSCDGILLENAKIVSIPKIDVRNNQAEINHEAVVGKIAGEQIEKLMTMGLSEKQAEEKIIEGFLK